MRRNRSSLLGIAAAIAIAPLGGLLSVGQDFSRATNRLLDDRPNRERGATTSLRASKRHVAQDKRDAVKRRNTLRAKGHHRQAVR